MPWSSDARPTDDEFLAMVRDRVGQIAPALVGQSQIRDGLLVGLPAWSVMMLPNHTDSASHFDIGFNADLDSGLGGIVTDCLSGVGPMPDALEQVLRIWLETSGACFLELLTRNGRYASRLDAGSPVGLPGWQVIVSPVTGYSYGAGDAGGKALRNAMLRNAVLSQLADHLLPLLTRPGNNGIKIFYFRGLESAIAEIRVNGVADPVASQALADLEWPAITEPAVVRCYAIATRSG